MRKVPTRATVMMLHKGASGVAGVSKRKFPQKEHRLGDSMQRIGKVSSRATVVMSYKGGSVVGGVGGHPCSRISIINKQAFLKRSSCLMVE